MVYSMAGSIYGRLFQISTWGESHGKGIGVVIDGCPAGLSLSEEDIQVYLSIFSDCRQCLHSCSRTVLCLIANG